MSARRRESATVPTISMPPPCENLFAQLGLPKQRCGYTQARLDDRGTWHGWARGLADRARRYLRA
eukprot:15450418-Alexandrium_andersonii.AAC.1